MAHAGTGTLAGGRVEFPDLGPLEEAISNLGNVQGSCGILAQYLENCEGLGTDAVNAVYAIEALIEAVEQRLSNLLGPLAAFRGAFLRGELKIWDCKQKSKS